MERLLAVERMNADGISIFGYRNNDSDFKKAINRRQTPERGNTDRPSFDRTCGCCRKNQCQGGIGFWGTEIAIFTSRKPLTNDTRNPSTRNPSFGSLAQGSSQCTKAADITTDEDSIQ
jgi:hypothetical protein